MNEAKARNVIREMGKRGEWIKIQKRPRAIALDGGFDADELEAMAWWLRNMDVEKCTPEDAYVLQTFGESCPEDCEYSDSCDFSLHRDDKK